MYIQYTLILTILFYLMYWVATKNPQPIRNPFTRRFESNHYAVLVLVIMVIMLFLRTFVLASSVSDILGYERALNDIDELSWSSAFTEDIGVRIETGYRLLMKLYSCLSTDINGFLFIHALISQILLYRILKRFSASPFISLTIYLIVMFCPSIYILRQYLAMLVLFNSIPYIIDRKPLPFIICTVIGVSIHNVSVVFFPIYFLYGIKSNWKLILALVLIFVGLKVSFTAVYYYFGDAVFSGLYDTYLYTDKYEGSNYTESYIALCILLAYVAIAWKHILGSEMDKLLFIAMCMGFSISFAGTSLPLVGRLALYYTFAMVLVIPRIMSYINPSFIKYAFAIVVLGLMYMAFFNDENMLSYRLIF